MKRDRRTKKLIENEKMLKALIGDAVEVTFRRTWDCDPDVRGRPKNERLQLYVRYAETDRTFAVLGCDMGEVLAKGSQRIQSAT